MTTTRKTPHTAKLAALADDTQQARIKLDETEQQRQHAASEITRLTNARIEAFASGDEQLATNIAAERIKAQAALADMQERHAGADRAVNRARATEDAYRGEHITSLLAETRPEAEAAARGLEDAVAAFSQAFRHLATVDAQVNRLMAGTRLAQHHTPHYEHWQTVDRDLRRLLTSQPPQPPLPRQQATATIPPTNNPDPEVRAQAQATVEASA
jgi:hypothetical protein